MVNMNNLFIFSQGERDGKYEQPLYIFPGRDGKYDI